MALLPQGALRPTRMTWVVFPSLAVTEFLITFFGGLVGQDFLQDLFWYQILWFGPVFQFLGLETAGADLFPNQLGIAAIGIAILIDLLAIYLISLYLSKRVFKNGFWQYKK